MAPTRKAVLVRRKNLLNIRSIRQSAKPTTTAANATTRTTTEILQQHESLHNLQSIRHSATKRARNATTIATTVTTRSRSKRSKNAETTAAAAITSTTYRNKWISSDRRFKSTFIDNDFGPKTKQRQQPAQQEEQAQHQQQQDLIQPIVTQHQHQHMGPSNNTKVVSGCREKPSEYMTEFESAALDNLSVRNEIINDPISIVKEEPSEYISEYETAAPKHLSMQYEIINDPISIVKEEPSEYMTQFIINDPDNHSVQFEIINDPIPIIKEEPSEMIRNEYFSPSSNDRTMPREDVQSKADNIVPTKIICDDDHMLFLRSLLPFFKKLDTTQTLRLRNKFKELLTQEINSNNLQNS